MRIDSRCLLILLLLLCLPSIPAAEEDAAGMEVPYPDRTFLYIVDCSGSMVGYQDALNTGRQMLSDLLPEEKTTVIAFTGTAGVVPSVILSFGGQTSVLAGVEKADEVLNTLWSADPARQVTEILFSDMNSSVQADGHTSLTEVSKNEENARLLEIQERWDQYTQAGNFNFYSLNWSVNPAPDEYCVSFSPISVESGAHQPVDTQSEDFTREILTACVEAYACVLTGSDGAWWTEAEISTSADTLTVSLEESYRTFLYLDQAPRGIDRDRGAVEFQAWTLSSGGCLLMIENADSGLYTLDGVSTDAQILYLTIPQPKITVKVSPDPVICFDNVTISIGTVAGDSYLGYDDSNSSCLLNISGTGDDLGQVLSGDYNEEPEDPTLAMWEPGTDNTGTVTVQGLKEGETTLLCTINYYEEGIDAPDNSQELTMRIAVLPRKDHPIPVWLIATLAGAAVAIAVVSILLIRRNKKPTS